MNGDWRGLRHMKPLKSLRSVFGPVSGFGGVRLLIFPNLSEYQSKANICRGTLSERDASLQLREVTNNRRYSAASLVVSHHSWAIKPCVQAISVRGGGGSGGVPLGRDVFGAGWVKKGVSHEPRAEGQTGWCCSAGMCLWRQMWPTLWLAL